MSDKASSWDWAEFKQGKRDMDKMVALRFKYGESARDIKRLAGLCMDGGFLHAIVMRLHDSYERDRLELDAAIKGMQPST